MVSLKVREGVESKLSGERDTTLLGFLGSLASNSSKISEFLESLLDDFLNIDTFFDSIGELALLLLMSSRLSRVSELSFMVGGIFVEVRPF